MQIDIDPNKLREDVIARCVDQVLGDFDYYGEISERISKAVDDKMSAEVDALAERAMNEALDAALRSTISPVDIWGEKTGEPKTLKEHIHQRAKDFWTMAVDKDGKASRYGGSPRYEYLLKGMVREEFQGVVKDNIGEIVIGLKEALRADMKAQLDKNLDAFMSVNKRR